MNLDACGFREEGSQETGVWCNTERKKTKVKKHPVQSNPTKNLIVRSNFLGGWTVDICLSSPNKLVTPAYNRHTHILWLLIS